MRIRLATTEDADAIRSIYAPIVTETAISFELDVPTRDELGARISKTLTAERPWLVCEVDDLVVAYAYATSYRERAAYAWSVETSIHVDRAHRGNGLGTQLYSLLMAVLEAQGYRSAYAAISQPNVASNALHARVGFSPVGTMRMAGYKLGAWRDVQWWQKQFATESHPPAPIRKLDEVLTAVLL